MDPDRYDPYMKGGRVEPPVYAPQDGATQVTENFAREHSPARSLLHSLGWFLLLTWLRHRYPNLGRLVVKALALLLVLGFLYILYRMHSSPENQPVHTNYGN